MLDSALMDAQLNIEQRSTAEGYARFTKEQETARKHEGSYAQSDAAKVIAGCIPLVAAELERWVAASSNAGKGRTHTAVSVLKRFPSYTLAYIALNQVFVGCTNNHAIAKVLVHIGTVLEGEVAALELTADQGRKVADRIRSQVNKQGSATNRRKAFRKLARSAGQQREEWANDHKARMGEPLLEAVLRALPAIFELATTTRGKTMTTLVRLTQEGVELLASVKDRIAWNAPIHRPMVVLPRPWAAFDSGCYYDEKAARNVRLVRTYDRDQQKRIRTAIRDGSMAHVLESVNAIQDTPWAINTEVLEVLEHCWSRNLAVPGLPSSQLVKLPERMDPSLYSAMSDFERKGVRINIAQLREKNRGIVADRAVMLRDLDTAKELSQYERFYLPHSLDFRGRVYPVCHFSHQRSDPIKALFRFADGCRYGEYGSAWASVHLANVGDFEKVSKRPFDTRLDWVALNQERILSVAQFPIQHMDWWGQADSPFCFLAACFEYARWFAQGQSEEFVGYLPVALDGSNSGLQHYSAALRAEDEAALVSLRPCEHPADLYQTVADQVKVEVEREAREGGKMADLALQVGVTRSLVKRNVMTFAYSSAQFGFRQQLLDDTMRPLNDSVLTGDLERNPWSQDRLDGTDDGGWQAANYLSKKVWAAVTATVTKATEGMDFFKQVAGVLARHGLPLEWTSPLGLPCTHAYRIWSTKAVQLFLYDRAVPVVDAGPRDKVEGDDVIRQVRANIRTKPTEALDKDKARSAVAPNVIHSMDGSHLMLTVLDAKDAGITSLALIHDSFGSHAGRTAEFSAIIRQAFVNLYENYDPFQEVYESAKLALNGDPQGLLPSPPPRGSFDLQEVLDADYAFA